MLWPECGIRVPAGVEPGLWESALKGAGSRKVVRRSARRERGHFLPLEIDVFDTHKGALACRRGGSGTMPVGIDLVTGGAGFIGSHLVDRLLAQGRTVYVFDNLVVGRRANLKQHNGNPRLRIVEADVADQAAVTAAMAGAERVFHLAARADIVPSIQEPEAYFRSNVDGTFCVLEAARRHAVKRFVYVASSSCYGIPSSYPTPETAPADPRYPYALTKYLGEQLVMHWAQVYQLPAVSVRFFNVYGPRARTSGTYGAVFGVFLAQLLAGEPLTIVGDGEQTRDFTFVADVVDALITVAEGDKIRRNLQRRQRSASERQ